ncbi:Protein pacG [Talaromyces atroroseus]|uniref:Protein pacG n=1 Tax=Talaromyces atroroseus TaxID=1441469 RepID=A0A225AK60_TALAT|nr:Protein pacG [Talaromyces atroroseus]OKL61912.1 Protein pacG [Talaromyces atroroseus]
MPYLASPLSLGHMQGTDYLNSMPGLDLPDQRSNFDAETFISGDDMSFSQANLPQLRRFSSYEEAFPAPAELLPPFESVAAEQQNADSIEGNHKLLSFSLPVYGFTLLDYSLRRTSLNVSAQLHGMFFLAESPWTNSPNEVPPPHVAELTCYRRNLFQITGSVTLPRSLRYIMTEQGDRIPILAQELTVSATESVEGNPVKIISVPWKTPAAAVANGSTSAPPPASEEKAEKEPPSIPLDTMAAGQDMDSDYATFPIAWKRLQFRIATANNGRRKELQQHFVVRLKVVATLSTGAKIPICEVHSGPVIVRGRSPRNFQSRKDLPLSGSAASSRKNQQAAARNSAMAAEAQAKATAASTNKNTNSPSEMSQIFSFEPRNTSSPPFADWTQIPAPATTGAITTPTFAHSHGMPPYPQSSPGVSRSTEHRGNVVGTPPINLSLVEDDFKTPSKPTDSHRAVISRENSSSGIPVTVAGQKRSSPEASGAPPAKMQKMVPSLSRPRPTRSISASLPLLQTSGPMQQPYHAAPSSYPTSMSYSGESADLLYEYFPLSVDDWQSPVDAVYRPHVVHHTHMPMDYKFMAARNRSKRYFAAEDVC